MKKLISILLTLALLAGLCVFATVSTSADGESTADTWDGTANIKWYLDAGADAKSYSIQTAEDLAGLAYLVNSGTANTCYDGVYYDAETGAVLGYRLSGKEGEYADTTLVYAAATDSTPVVEGNSFVWRTILLENDLILNEGNAADWATTAPANVWQPIGGGRDIDATSSGFNGMFDGQGHTISGIYFVAGTDGFACALFGYAGKASNTSFSNLTIDNFYIEGTYSVGGLVGRSNKPIEVQNVFVTNGILKSLDQQAAPFVAAVFGGAALIENCGAENVDMLAYSYAGGFVATSVGQTVDVKNSYVKNCSITMDGGSEAGQIVGRAAGGAINLENVYTIIEIDQPIKQEEIPSGSDRMATVGVIYGGQGSGSKAVVSASGFYYVKNLNGENIIGEDTEGAIEVTEAQLTGDFAKATLEGFDFDTVWDVTAEGTPFINIRELPDTGDQGGSGDSGNTDSGNSGNSGNSGSNTTKPATTDPVTTPNTNAPTTEETPSEEKGGCGSAIGFASVAAITMILGSALMIKNKEN